MHVPPPCGKVSPMKTVTVRPVQIGANHYIDVYTDINEVTVMHPEFQKWCSVGPWFLENGAHAAKYGFGDFCQLQFS